MSNIKKRLKSSTPTFFKKIGNIGVVLGVIGAALSVPTLGLPVIIGASLIAIGTTAKAVSQLVVENPKDLN